VTPEARRERRSRNAKGGQEDLVGWRWFGLGILVLAVVVLGVVVEAGAAPTTTSTTLRQGGRTKGGSKAATGTTIEISGHVALTSYGNCLSLDHCGALQYDSVVVVRPKFKKDGTATVTTTAAAHVENHLHVTFVSLGGSVTPLDCDRVDDVTIPVIVTATRTKKSITVSVKPTAAALPMREVCGEEPDAVGNLTLPAMQEVSMETPEITVHNKTASTTDVTVDTAQGHGTLDGTETPFGTISPFGRYVPIGNLGETGLWRVTLEHA
jgi:hypothetical protein